MAVSKLDVLQLCDPARFSLREAVAEASKISRRTPELYLEMARLFKELCLGARPDLDVIGRMLDLIVAVAPACTLLVVLRPILRDCSPRLRSKCFLVLAQYEQNLGWAEKLMADEDGRIRASVIEGLWDVKAPEVERLFTRAVHDRHHRVAANAVYGLHLRDPQRSVSLIERLIANQSPAFRSAGAWVIRKSGSLELRNLLKPLINDKDPAVRHAGFKALMSLRQEEARN